MEECHKLGEHQDALAMDHAHPILLAVLDGSIRFRPLLQPDTADDCLMRYTQHLFRLSGWDHHQDAAHLLR